MVVEEDLAEAGEAAEEEDVTEMEADLVVEEAEAAEEEVEVKVEPDQETVDQETGPVKIPAAETQTSPGETPATSARLPRVRMPEVVVVSAEDVAADVVVVAEDSAGIAEVAEDLETDAAEDL